MVKKIIKSIKFFKGGSYAIDCNPFKTPEDVEKFRKELKSKIEG